MINFLKGIIIGLGGIAPGLSGSVLMVIFGLYEKTVEAISTIFKEFKKNVLFLIPIILGIGIGAVIFGKIVEFLLNNFDMYTRFAFLGLVIGTIPLFYKEMKKKEFKNKYYILMLISFVFGFILFFINDNLFPPITDPNIFQSFLLGIAYAGSSIIPGIDSAVILSALGMYETWVSAIANPFSSIPILIPAGIGLGLGILILSYVMNKLLKNYYGITFAIIFGLFISIIPSVLNEGCTIGLNVQSFIAIAIAIVGILVSYFLGRLKKEENEEVIQ